MEKIALIQYLINPQDNPVYTDNIFRVVRLSVLFSCCFSVEVATAALTASLIISAAFQITALRRYFYVGRGLLNRFTVLLLFSAAAGFKLAHTSPIDLPVALGVSIVPSLCLFPSCMNISARILPELTPLGIIKIIIKATKLLIHCGNRVMPEPQESLHPASGGNSQPPPALKPAPSIKDRGAGLVKPDASGAVR
jgi:hypothetical protein